MKIELSDAAFLDLMEQKVRLHQYLLDDERTRLCSLSGTVRDKLGTQARVNVARQRIIDRVTKALVEHDVPRFLHTFLCPRCSAAWMADSWISRPLMACSNTMCHETLIAPRFTEDRGFGR